MAFVDRNMAFGALDNVYVSGDISSCKQVDLPNLLSIVIVFVALSCPRVVKKKRATNARQPGSYGNSLTGSEPGTKRRVQDGRDIIYGKNRRGRYGMVVHEQFDSTVVPMAERTPVAPLYPQGRFEATLRSL